VPPSNAPSEISKKLKNDAFTDRLWPETVRRRCNSFTYCIPSDMLCYYKATQLNSTQLVLSFIYLAIFLKIQTQNLMDINAVTHE
jgi:hypothetical protein